MADISRITLPSGITYDIKDATARAAIAGGTTFLGITTTALADGDTTQTISISGNNVAAINGGIAIYQNKEFIYSETDTQWHEIGDTTNLGDLASYDSASGTYTPSGTVSQPTFTGTAMNLSTTVQPSGTVSKPTFTGTQGSVTVTGTPSGTISVGAGTANYTPNGTVSTPTITVTPNTTTKYVASSATGGGSVSSGTSAACTFPEMTTSVSNETLTIGWNGGTFTPNTPTSVTLPTFSSQTIATGIQEASATQPTFSGAGVELAFTGASLTSTGNFTPAGSVSQPTFDGSDLVVEISGTPSGTVSQPSFTGTQGSVTVYGDS